MSDATAPTPTSVPAFAIDVSSDRLTVTLTITGCEPVDIEAVRRQIALLNLKGVDDLAPLEHTLKQGASSSIVICRGQAPQEPQPQQFELGVVEADDATATTSLVDAGQKVARSIAAVAGVDGCDVSGKPIPCKRAGQGSRAGKNISIVGKSVTSTIRGNVRCIDGELFVEPLTEISETTAGTILKLDISGDAVVSGSVVDGSRVTASGSLTVRGDVNDAYINVLRSLHVVQGITGSGKGKCLIDHHVWADHLRNACVVAGGDVTARGDVTNSRVVRAGAIRMPAATIVGGKTIAGAGLWCRSIGDRDGTPTLVAAGATQVLPIVVVTSKVAIDTNLARSKAIRQQIEPMARQMKLLSPREREHVTELVAQAEELDMISAERSAQLEEIQKKIKTTSLEEIHVTDKLFAGTVVRFGVYEAAVAAEVSGPLKIGLRRIGAQCQVAVWPKSTPDAEPLVLSTRPVSVKTKAAGSTGPGTTLPRAAA